MSIISSRILVGLMLSDRLEGLGDYTHLYT